MRLVLGISSGSLEFTEPNSGGAYDLLLSVGTMRVAARAGDAIGLAANESSSIAVTLNNAGRRAAKLVGAPLRVRGQLYDKNNDLFFDGVVAMIDYAPRTITLELGA